MRKTDRFRKLDSLLRYEDGYTVMELLALLDEDITLRTLRKDLEDLQKEPYNVQYASNMYRGKERLYRYKNTNFMLFGHSDEFQDKIEHFLTELDTFSGIPQFDWMRLFFVELSSGMLSNRVNIVSFDNNTELQGINYLIPLAQAIVHKQPLKITYKPFNSDRIEVKIHPYHLRQFNNRWFLFGLNEDQQRIYNYPLDRIESICDLCKNYVESKIDFDEYFDDIIGVSVTDTPIETIELKVRTERYPYIKTKPLHSTQKECKALSTEEYKYLNIKVRINKELITKLASFGPDIEVISPESLRSIIRDKVIQLYNIYK